MASIRRLGPGIHNRSVRRGISLMHQAQVLSRAITTPSMIRPSTDPTIRQTHGRHARLHRYAQHSRRGSDLRREQATVLRRERRGRANLLTHLRGLPHSHPGHLIAAREM